LTLILNHFSVDYNFFKQDYNMATDKTPPHKRIERAEKSVIKWRMKSNERREEIERLNLIMKGLKLKISKMDEINKTITQQNKQLELLKQDLQQAQTIIAKQDNIIEELKKKGF
jgi:DNA repair exonuclease SbcCD ATPase subunit